MTVDRDCRQKETHRTFVALALKNFFPPLQTFPHGLTLKSPELFFKRQPLCLPVCARAGAYHKALEAVGGDAQVLAVQSYFWAMSRREMERKGKKSWRWIQSEWGDPEEGKRLPSSESASPATSSAPACVEGIGRNSPVEKHKPTRTPYYSSLPFFHTKAHSFWTLPPRGMGLNIFGLQ